MNQKLMIVSWVLLGVIASSSAFSSPPAGHNAASFGAKGDGKTLNTIAFQKAIDATPKGGVLTVGPGQYVTGTLKLKSNMELHLSEGAELLGSTSLDDYARDNQGAIEAPAFNKCLLYAEHVTNLKITGKGSVNGQGTRENFPVKLEDGSLGDRPMLIRFVDSQNITFSDVTLKNAASWCSHLVSCDDVVIQNVTIDSQVNTNNDGFDLDGCRNVLIENSTLRTGDDSICPKSTTTRLCEEIIVRNTRAQSHTAAFKCGTSSRGGFRNMTVSDCDFSGCRMGVIKLLAVDGGVLENITISNIVMNDVEGPIFIRLGNRGRTYDKPTEQIYGKKVKSEGAPPGVVKNIRISNVKATVTGDDPKRNGIMISGIPGHFIEDVVLENVDITFPGGGTAEDAARVVPEDIARYPEQFFFGTLPAWGAYIRHARNVEFKNVNLTTRRPDQRKKIVLVDVDGFIEK
ncbi:glycosyl hydrolase family 28 protein [Pontiellaceae bacterium B12227]|nr:glycosyl hydrolase family 28 protein [Pontiellaceae bacterium B12227]